MPDTAEPTARQLLDVVAPPRTLDNTPSHATRGALVEALASDDLEVVKAHLAHVWAHYQSLESALTSEGVLLDAVDGFAAVPSLAGLDRAELAARVVARVVLDAAYYTAHDAMDAMAAGVDPYDAVRALYEPVDPLAALDAELDALVAGGDAE